MGPVEVATRVRLEEMGKLATVDGAVAIVIARKLDHGGDTGSSITAMSSRLESLLKLTPTAGDGQAVDPVAQVQQKRRERHLRVVGA